MPTKPANFHNVKSHCLFFHLNHREVLTKIIQPLYFQGVTISTLPESLYETLDAPVPFLIGNT